MVADDKLGYLVARKKFFILDLDGTLYKGGNVFPFTRKFLSGLRASGCKPIFLTNNSSKSSREYLHKLTALGLQPAFDEIYTSGRAMIEFLQEKGLRKVFLLAPPAVHDEFRENGIETVESRGQQGIQAVVLAFDTTFNYEKFCAAYDLIVDGVAFYATHPDFLLPIEGGRFLPDIGTLMSAFYVATGRRPKIIGKPEKIIYRQLQRHLNCRKEEMIAFGDRLYTDIAGAKNFGITSVLVLSGETSADMLKKSRIKPDFFIKDLSEV